VTNLTEVFFRTVGVYLSLLLAFRLLGKREFAQFTAFDLLMLLLISGAVRSSMVGDNTRWPGGMVAGGTLILLSVIFSRAEVLFPKLKPWLDGKPAVLARDGRLDGRAMKRERVAMDDVQSAMREQGLLHLDDVALATLELDGHITVVPKGKK
jgi:uncharacterized membrane protein YcaP (DUF421 family)